MNNILHSIPFPIQCNSDFQEQIEHSLNIYKAENSSFAFPKSAEYFQNLKNQITQNNPNNPTQQCGLITLANVVAKLGYYSEAYYLYFMANTINNGNEYQEALIHIAKLLFMNVLPIDDTINQRDESKKIFYYLTEKYKNENAKCYLYDYLYSKSE